MEKRPDPNVSESILDEDLTNIVPPIIDQEEANAQPGCLWSCMFYSFWWCLWYSNQNLSQNKAKFVSRFKKWLKIRDRKIHCNSVTDDLQNIFDLMTRLYAHDEKAVDELAKWRINPDFTSYVRSDLEFFIPEISSFYLQGKFEEQEKLLDLLTSGSSLSFFFSHRLYFFFKSVMSTPGCQDVRSECLAAMQEIQSLCEYERPENMLYLANSKDLIKYIKKLRVDGLYPNLKKNLADDDKGKFSEFGDILYF